MEETLLGPLSFLYSWESLLLSVIIYSVTRSVKHGVLIISKTREIENRWVRYVLFPLVPLVVGSIVCVLIPIHPQQIKDYAAGSGVNKNLFFMAYGAALGQFADYLHHRIRGILKVKEKSD